MLFRREPEMPPQDAALPGRSTPIDPGDRHFVNGNPIKGPWPPGFDIAVFGNGCFWGTEEAFWKLTGVYSTAVGYIGGYTPNPTYDEVCSGMTGHTEATLVVFDPNKISYEQLLKVFWEDHDPTQGMRQGNDIGTQYRSGIYPVNVQQREIAEASIARYQPVLTAAGYDEITTEIKDIELERDFFYAEDYHQQYLAKNPNGYRCASATGVAYTLGAADELVS
ncbi:MAG: peptide-methionine (S)-S-oxide reductase MsrA [Solirubrobacterales bacterium]